MPLQSSGPISLAGSNASESVSYELRGTTTSSISLNDSDVRALLGASSSSQTTISLSAARGKSLKTTASGGSVYTSGGYKYHVFTSSSTFTVSNASTLYDMEILCVGGGGGGNGKRGGGGGAGGVRNVSAAVSTGTYVVYVGAGGSRGPTSDIWGGSVAGSGGDSYVSLYGSEYASSRAGGGGGAGFFNIAGASGRSNNGNGGGAGSSDGYQASPGAGNGLGYSGGPQQGGGANYGGSGGGGAGGVGGSNTGTHAGGPGTNAYSAWAAATGTGSSGYYAGGGGGGVGYYGAGGAGGIGGGAAGGTTTDGQLACLPAPANLGGGGGGASDNAGWYGGSGGSGIVIIRYPA